MVAPRCKIDWPMGKKTLPRRGRGGGPGGRLARGLGERWWWSSLRVMEKGMAMKRKRRFQVTIEGGLVRRVFSFLSVRQV